MTCRQGRCLSEHISAEGTPVKGHVRTKELGIKVGLQGWSKNPSGSGITCNPPACPPPPSAPLTPCLAPDLAVLNLHLRQVGAIGRKLDDTAVAVAVRDEEGAIPVGYKGGSIGPNIEAGAGKLAFVFITLTLTLALLLQNLTFTSIGTRLLLTQTPTGPGLLT